ncbi:unnamed protein product [Pipistrellus nathusii]|uniref:Uncharacterized protein n=1 Tax=Pipistrellus nathusii TaxID=59473 RepID=A0ABN9ZUH4_PIPNA
MLTREQIEHCLSHYPGTPFHLSRAGPNDPSLIIMGMAVNPTLEMHLGGNSLRNGVTAEPGLSEVMRQCLLPVGDLYFLFLYCFSFFFFSDQLPLYKSSFSAFCL